MLIILMSTFPRPYTQFSFFNLKGAFLSLLWPPQWAINLCETAKDS